MSSEYISNVTTANPFLYYRFEEMPDAGPVIDSSINEYHIPYAFPAANKIAGVHTWSNYAVHTDTGLNTAAKSAGVSNLTVEFLFRETTPGKYVIVDTNDALDHAGATVEISETSSGSGNYVVKFGMGLTGWDINTSDTHQHVFVHSQTVNQLFDGTWHHVVCVWAGTASAAWDATQLTLYVDGVDHTDTTTRSTYALTGTSGAPATAPLTLADTWWILGPAGGASQAHSADIDELAIYHSSLTSSTVLTHYNSIATFETVYEVETLSDIPPFTDGVLQTVYETGTVNNFIQPIVNIHIDSTSSLTVTPSQPDSLAGRQILGAEGDINLDLAGTTLESGEPNSAGYVGTLWFELPASPDLMDSVRLVLAALNGATGSVSIYRDPVLEAYLNALPDGATPDPVQSEPHLENLVLVQPANDDQTLTLDPDFGGSYFLQVGLLSEAPGGDPGKVVTETYEEGSLGANITADLQPSSTVNSDPGATFVYDNRVHDGALSGLIQATNSANALYGWNDPTATAVGYWIRIPSIDPYANLQLVVGFGDTTDIFADPGGSVYGALFVAGTSSAPGAGVTANKYNIIGTDGSITELGTVDTSAWVRLEMVKSTGLISLYDASGSLLGSASGSLPASGNCAQIALLLTTSAGGTLTEALVDDLYYLDPTAPGSGSDGDLFDFSWGDTQPGAGGSFDLAIDIYGQVGTSSANTKNAWIESGGPSAPVNMLADFEEGTSGATIPDGVFNYDGSVSATYTSVSHSGSLGAHISGSSGTIGAKSDSVDNDKSAGGIWVKIPTLTGFSTSGVDIYFNEVNSSGGVISEPASATLYIYGDIGSNPSLYQTADIKIYNGGPPVDVTNFPLTSWQGQWVRFELNTGGSASVYDSSGSVIASATGSTFSPTNEIFIDAFTFDAGGQLNIDDLYYKSSIVPETRALWWNWHTPNPVLGTTFSATTTSASDFSLAVYHGTSLTDLTLVTSSTDLINSGSIHFMPNPSDDDYYIRIGTSDGNTDFTLSWVGDPVEIAPADFVGNLRVTVHAGPLEWRKDTSTPAIPAGGLIAELPNRTNIQFQDALNTPGNGSLTLRLNDPTIRAFGPKYWPFDDYDMWSTIPQTITDDDPFQIVGFGNIIKVWMGYKVVGSEIEEKCVFAFTIRDREINVIGEGEEADKYITVSGPSILYLLHDFMVETDTRVIGKTPDARRFDWSSPSTLDSDLWAKGGWYDSTGALDVTGRHKSWNQPFNANTLTNPPGWKVKRTEPAKDHPKYALYLTKTPKWPDPDSRWLWEGQNKTLNTSNTNFPGYNIYQTHYYRTKSFRFPYAGKYRFVTCSDTGMEVYLNGVKVTSSNDVEKYSKIRIVEKTGIPAGPATIAIHSMDVGFNIRGGKNTDADHNDAVIMCVQRWDDSAKVWKTVLRTNRADWVSWHGTAINQKGAPSWSKAMILRQIVLDAKNRGNTSAKLIKLPNEFGRIQYNDLTGYSAGYSNANKWSDEKQVSMSIPLGTSCLDVQSGFSEGGVFDVWIDYETLELRASSNRGMDVSTNVALVPGYNLLNWSVAEKDEIYNSLLVKYKGGYVTANQDKSIEKWGTREGYLELGNYTDASTAQARAIAMMGPVIDVSTIGGSSDIVAHQREEYKGSLIARPGAVPFLDFEVGDVIAAPKSNGFLHPHRVLSLSCTEDENGNLTFDPELEGI